MTRADVRAMAELGIEAGKLKSHNELLLAGCQEWKRLHAESSATIAEQQREIARLRTNLEKYGQHTGDCAKNKWMIQDFLQKQYGGANYSEGPELDCTCGFTARAEERKISPQDVTNLLVGLRYDTCDKHDSCEPCKGLRQESIAAIESLQKTVAELRADRERLVTALGFADDWISKAPHGDNCHLHDTGEFAQCFCGKTNVRDELALASPPAAEEPAGITACCQGIVEHGKFFHNAYCRNSGTAAAEEPKS